MSMKYNLLNTKLRKRLSQLDQCHDPDQKFKLLKRYLSHFVKLTQYGRHFEESFVNHLQMIVTHLNDRRRQPVDAQVLGTIMKTLCVICYITDVPYQIVIKALQGLLEIFERISSKETLNVLRYCENHFKKMVFYLQKFKHFKIQQQLLELIHMSSLAIVEASERENYIKQFAKLFGNFLDKLLSWKSSRVTEKCRQLLLESQGQDSDMFSLSVEDCKTDAYRLVKPNNTTTLWLDFNAEPATISFAAVVSIIYNNNKKLEMAINLELMQDKVSQIELVEGPNNSALLMIKYENICLDPGVISISEQGTLSFTLTSGFDRTRLLEKILPHVQMNYYTAVPKDQHSVSTNIDIIFDISKLESIASETITVQNLDHSQRLRDNRDAIEQHQNIRCELLNDTSKDDSNKENEAPNVTSDLRVSVQDVQRLRVFENLREGCRKQQSRQRSTEQSITKPELDDLSLQRSAKRRKLFEERVEENDLDVSKDSQIQRAVYVEGKLVNTVKPMKSREKRTNVERHNLNCPKERDVINESSTTDFMSSEEFEHSMKAYINNNGIFGITQQKILNKKLEKNIRKINQMVDRSAKRFFKREANLENPYDFNEPSDKKRTRKINRSKSKGSKRKSEESDEEYLPNKIAKNTTNALIRRNKSRAKLAVETGPNTSNIIEEQKTEKKPSRVSLPRTKKPSILVDMILDTENKKWSANQDILPVKNKFLDTMKLNTFEDLNISSIEPSTTHQQRKPVTKGSLVKSKPAVNDTDDRRTLQTYKDTKHAQLPGKANRESSEINASILMRRDYQKSQKTNILRETAARLIQHEKDKAQLRKRSSSQSENSIRPNITMDNLTSLPCHSKAQNEKTSPFTLTEARVEAHCSNKNKTPILHSTNVNPRSSSSVFENLNDGAKYDLKYANNNYLLNKFIVSSQNTQNLKRADSIVSEDIRVGNNFTDPPSMGDLSEVEVVPNHNDSILKENNNIEQEVQFYSKTTPENSKKRVSFDTEKVTKTRAEAESAKQPETQANSTKMTHCSAIQTIMIEHFTTKIHQELNPALVQMENKMQRLDLMNKAFERLSTNFHGNEILNKCKEILHLETRLDKILDDVVQLCGDSVERSNQAVKLVRKLVLYDEAKREKYKEQLQSGRQEMPIIVDECIKSVWNEQVLARIGQLEQLITKMLM
ncbi:uncharacterized protein LOC131430950 [Malaya genurostris]|uniref:uncharacterized protein LOC131430950 n=1 Tax=Malaya genurostris TaxID=325434 RepID=UPI0026F3CF0F|nr:uncharacterized protein LOC131430950 [Malaya genurostris]